MKRRQRPWSLKYGSSSVYIALSAVVSDRRHWLFQAYNVLFFSKHKSLIYMEPYPVDKKTDY